VGGKPKEPLLEYEKISLFPRYVENLVLLGYEESLPFIGSKGKILP
jgi:hypothetical protein